MKFVVTAGPTREPLDPVRFLSNRSSGKMGYAIAAAALEQRHHVVLISGPVAISAPAGADLVSVVTSDEMSEAMNREVSDADVLVMCAAVCDYKPAQYSDHKMAKQRAPFSLPLVPTRDILGSLTKRNAGCLVVGFAAETQDFEKNARRKLEEKDCDLIVANDVSQPDLGMDSDENEVTIFFRDGSREKLSRAKKTVLAQTLLKIILNVREKCLTKNS